MNNIGEIDLKKEKSEPKRLVEFLKKNDVPIVNVHPVRYPEINSLAWLEGK